LREQDLIFFLWSPAEPTSAIRFTEIYDGYLNSYNEAAPPPAPALTSGEKIGAWARANVNPSQTPMPALQRSISRSAPSSPYAPSSYGGGGVRRKLTRRNTRRTTPASNLYNEEEEEEGYVSGEYDDGPFELVKIRVKVRSNCHITLRMILMHF